VARVHRSYDYFRISIFRCHLRALLPCLANRDVTYNGKATLLAEARKRWRLDVKPACKKYFIPFGIPYSMLLLLLLLLLLIALAVKLP
jgi:hypothetical protein